MDGFNSRLDMAKECISGLKDRTKDRLKHGRTKGRIPKRKRETKDQGLTFMYLLTQ